MKTEKQIVFWYFKSYDKTVNCDAFEIEEDCTIHHTEHWENVAVDNQPTNQLHFKPYLWNVLKSKFNKIMIIHEEIQ